MFKRNARFVFILFLGLSSCKIADLSQETGLSVKESERTAKEKLAESIAAQGFGALEEKNTYQVTASNHWAGLLGKIAKPWPDALTEFEFYFNFNTFDGKAKFLSGKQEGQVIGLQSGEFYESDESEKSVQKVERLNKDQKKQKMGLEVLHYFIELPLRLSNAPILRYYGEKTQHGENYELIFASWETEAANKKYDQFVLWINEKTKLVDYVFFTVRENKSIFKRSHHSSMVYQNYRKQKGFLFPEKITVFIDDQLLHAEPDDYLHEYVIREFKLSAFEEEILYPLPGLEKRIDAK